MRQHAQSLSRPTNCAMTVWNELVVLTFAFICIFTLHNAEASAAEVRKLIVHLYTWLTELSPSG